MFFIIVNLYISIYIYIFFLSSTRIKLIVIMIIITMMIMIIIIIIIIINNNILPAIAKFLSDPSHGCFDALIQRNCHFKNYSR